jgi:small-conductance mechanosensitive channel
MGSTTFQLGNILLFIFILYISHLLQKGVGSLYGKASESWDPDVRKNASRLAIMRLTLIVIGFLIAVAASGLPVDKITIVLGALGVGIGLGLQSIVNNFVSGIILIFEQPFRIGDYIELGDKKGRVLDIGIRSSKLLMEEGAEVIMPNADLLSGRVINWTIHNDNIRIEIPLSLEPGHPFDEVSTTIAEALKESDNVMKEQQSEVLLTSINDKAMNVTVRVWINNVHREQIIRGELLNKIHDHLTQKGIKML